MELNLVEENRIEWYLIDLLSVSFVLVIRLFINYS